MPRNYWFKSWFFLFAFLFVGKTEAQVKFKVALTNDSTNYQVSLYSETGPFPGFADNFVPSATVTVIAPTGQLNPTTKTNLKGLWSGPQSYINPIQGLDRDYFVYTLTVPITDITFTPGIEVDLFSFGHTGNCAGEVELMDNDTDPFRPELSNINAGNHITVNFHGLNNAYSGQHEPGSANCIGEPECELSLTSVTATNVTSCGASNGTISVSTSGGTGTIQYSIDNGANWFITNNFSGLSTGNYTVKVKDDLCELAYINNPVSIVGPSITVNLSGAISPSCNASQDGTLTVTASGGSGSYQYSIDNGANWSNSNIFPNLTNGNYRVKARNLGGGCEGSYSLNPVVFSTPIIGIQASKTDVACENASNGTISIAASGGSGSFQYSIDNGDSWENTANFSNLAAGNYTIKVRNSNGNCETAYANNPLVIGQGALSILVASNNPSCDAAADGSISIANINQGLNLEYSINNGVSWFTNPNFANLPIGEYLVKARLVGGACEIAYANNPVQLTASPIIVSVSTVSNGCSSGAGNSISVSASGGTGNFQYSIDNGSNWQISPVFSGLTNGNFSVKVRNNNSTCVTDFADNPVSLTGTSISVSVNATPPTCTNVSDGRITINASGGSGSYIYSLDDGQTYSNLKTSINLANGNYRIVVKNADGTCPTAFAANPVQFNTPTLNLAISATKASCPDINDGQLILVGNGGNNGYQFSIDNGQNWTNNALHQNLASGSYNLFVRNANQTCITPYANNPVDLTPDGTTDCSAVMFPTCFLEYILREDNGVYTISLRTDTTWTGNLATTSSAQISVRVPTGAFELSNLTNKIAGASFGFGGQSINVSQAPGFDYIAFSLQNITSTIPYVSGDTVDLFSFENKGGCFGGDMILVGDGALPDPNIPNFGYEGQITVAGWGGPDAPICNSPFSVQLCTLVIDTVLVTDATSCGEDDGAISITATCTNTDTEYSIDNGRTYQSSPDFSNLAAGNYFIRVRNDTSNCEEIYNENPVVLSDGTSISFTATATPPTCADARNGAITFTANNGNGNFLYSVDDGRTWSINATFTGVPVGDFYLKVSNTDTTCITSFATTFLTVHTDVICGADADNDGQADHLEDLNQDGDLTNDDTDGDMIPNYQDDDDDNDGILTIMEEAGPNNGDSNGDSTSDCLQASVATTQDNDGGYRTLEVGNNGCEAISSFIIQSEENLSEADPDYEFPLDLNSFSIPCGGTVDIILYYHNVSDLDNFVYRKYGPLTPGGANSVWYTFPVSISTDIIAGVTVGKVTFQLTDGQLGDATGVDNLIVDPGGLTMQVVNKDTIAVSLDAGATTTTCIDTELDLPNNVGTATILAQDAGISAVVSPMDSCVQITANGAFAGTAFLSIAFCDAVNTNICDTTVYLVTVNAVPANVDTLAIVMDYNDTIAVCLDAVLDLVNGTGAASLCSNGTVINGIVTNADNCVNLQAPPGFSGMDTLCVIHCDDVETGFCDTTYLLVEVGEAASCKFEYLIEIVEEEYTVSLAVSETVNAPFNATTSMLVSMRVPVVGFDVPTDSITTLLAGASFENTSSGVLIPTGATEFGYINFDLVSTVNPNYVAGDTLDLFSFRPVDCTGGNIHLVGTGADFANPTIEGEEITSYLAIGQFLADGAAPSCVSNIGAAICLPPPPAQRDTLQYVLNFEEGQTICIDDALQLLNGVGGVSICEQGNNVTLSVTNGDTCIMLLPANNFSGMDTLCVIHCDTFDTDFCDTTILLITVNPNDATPPPTDECALNLDLEQVGDTYVVSMTPDTTFPPTFFSGLTLAMNIVVRAPAGELTAVNLINDSTGYEFRIVDTELAPLETPDYDYITFGLKDNNTPTPFIRYTAGEKIKFFTFQNVSCGLDSIALVGDGAAFASPIIGGNTLKSNANVNGWTDGDIPVCVNSNPLSLCLTKPDTVQIELAAGANYNICLEQEVNLPNGTGDVEICQQGTEVTLTTMNGDSCISFAVSNSFSTEETLCAIFCDAVDTNFCDTVYFVLRPPAVTACTVEAGENRTVCDGSAVLLSAIGTAPNFSWTPAIGLSCTDCPNPIANPDTTTTYYVTNSNGTDCSVTDSVVLTVASPNIGASVSGSSCAENNGSITVFASLTGETLEFQIDNGEGWQTSNTFDSLAPGSYNLMVRITGGGCETAYQNNPIQINGLAAPVLDSVQAVSPSDCGSIDGSITVFGSGANPLIYSIDGGSNWSENSVFAGLGAGTYAVHVAYNDTTCVSLAQGVTLSGAAAPTIISITSSNPTICGGQDGVITVTVQNDGSGQFEYSTDSITWQSSNVFTNLSAGTYDIYVRYQGETCAAQAPSATVLDAVSIPIINGVTTVDPTGVMDSNGSITISATGTSALEYSINNGGFWQSDSLFSALDTGTYTILVRYADLSCGAAFNSPVILRAGSSCPTVTTVASTDPTGCATANGSITITASINNNIEYSINNGADWQINNVFNNLSADTYTILIRTTDLFCEVPYGTPVVLNPGSDLTISAVNSTNPSTCDSSDGSITIAANGSSNLEYSIDNGALWQSNNVFNNLPAGTYTILTRTSDLVCAANYPTPMILSPITGLTITDVNATQPSGCGANNGNITIVANGSANLEYSINNGADWQSSNVFLNLPTGTYDILVRTTNLGCSVAYNTPITLNDGGGIIISDVTSINPTTCNGTDGSILITASGPNSLEYSIDNGASWQVANQFLNLSEGNYFIRVRAGTCDVTYNNNPVTLGAQNGFVVINPVPDQAMCTLGSIPVTITLSENINQYLVNSGAISNPSLNGATLTFTADAAGLVNDYSITFSNAIGCEVTETFVIYQALDTEADFVVIEPYCKEMEVSLLFTGTATPSANLIWELDGGQLISSSAATATAPPGAEIIVRWDTEGSRLIQLTVNDGGCIDDEFESIFVRKLPLVDAGEDASICMGSCVQLEGSGTGVWYTWSPARGLSDPDIPDPLACPTETTTYTLTVMSADGCVSVDSVTITVETNFLTVSDDIEICPGATTTLVASGSDSYQWIPTATLSDPSISNPVASPLETTTYSVFAANNNGCMDTAMVTVTVTPIEAVACADKTICEGDSVQLVVTTHAQYAWSPSNTLINPTTGVPIAFPSETTTYTVTVTDENGCTDTDEVTIFVNPKPEVTVSSDVTICPGSFTILGANGADSYLWSPAESLNDPTLAKPTANPLVTTTFTVIGYNGDGCRDSAQVTVQVDEGAGITAAGTATICEGDSTQLSATGGSDYSWSPTIGLDDHHSANPIASPSQTTTYTVIGINPNGCSVTSSVTVIVLPKPEAIACDDKTICNGDSIQLIVTTHAQYQWSPTNSLLNPTSGTPTAFPTETTTYSVTVTDENGCTDTDEVIIFVNNSTTLNLGPDITLCEGGEVSLDAGAGLSYQWSPTTGLSDPTIRNPIATVANTITYTVVVGNEFGCNSVDDITISVTGGLIADAGPPVVICPGSSGQLNASGGVSYQWSPTTGLSDPTIPNPIVTTNQVTTYRVTVTDENGCTDTDETLVAVSLPLTIDPTITNANCCGQDGSAIINVSGGFGNAIFDWTPNVSNTNQANNLSPGFYKVLITDAQGCSIIFTFEIKEECDGCPDMFAESDRCISDTSTVERICLPIPLEDIGNYQILVDGNNYIPDHGCEHENLSAYSYALVEGQGNTGMYKVENWEVDGQMYAVEVETMQDLTDWMNNVDPTGNWVNNPAILTIIGGDPSKSYGTMQVVQLTKWIETTLQPNTTGIAISSIIEVDVSNLGRPIEVVIINPETCCADTITLRRCGDTEVCLEEIIAETQIEESIICGGTANICLDFPAANIGNYDILVDNAAYAGELADCDIDSMFTYSYFSIPDQGDQGPYYLTNWMVDGQMQSGMFDDIADLVPLMNQIDPTGNWVLDPNSFTLQGGHPGTAYGSMMIEQTNTNATATLEINSSLIPMGVALTFPAGNYDVLIVNKITGCQDGLNILVSCGGDDDSTPPVLDTMDTNPIDTMDTTPMDTMDTTPVDTMDTTPVDTMDTTPVDTMDTTPVDTMDTTPVDTMDTTPVDTIDTTPVDTMDTTPVDTMDTTPVDTMDTTPVDTMDTTPVDTMDTTPVDTMDTTPVDTMDTSPVDTMDTSPVDTIDTTPVDTTDTTPVDTMTEISCTDFITEDFLSQTISRCDSMVSFCIDIPFDEISDYDIFIDRQSYQGSLSACLSGTNVTIGVGGFNFIFENKTTGCRDSIILALTCQPTSREEVIRIVEGFSQVYCPDASQLLGDIVRISNACPTTGSTIINTILDTLDYCVTFEGLTLGEETTCIVICDDRGICDTTFVTVQVLPKPMVKLPVANRDVDSTKENTAITIIVLANDSVFGTLQNMEILEKPSSGTAVINADNSITYTPKDGFCDSGQPDIIMYGICNDNGCDTTIVEVWVPCSMLEIMTGFSPNGDGINDVFKIKGVEDFPNNEVKIFNRWGSLVFEQKEYKNAWDGRFNNKILPDGTYFYLFKDGKGKQYAGYVQIQR